MKKIAKYLTLWLLVLIGSLLIGCEDEAPETTTTTAGVNMNTIRPDMIADVDAANELMNELLQRHAPLSELTAYPFDEYAAWVSDPGCDESQELYEFNQKFPVEHAEKSSYNESAIEKTFIIVTKLEKDGFDQPIYAYLPFRKYTDYYYRLAPYYCTKSLSSSEFESISIGDSAEKIRSIEPAAGIVPQITKVRYGISSSMPDNRQHDILLILQDGVLDFVFEENENGELVIAYKVFFEYYQVPFIFPISRPIDISEWTLGINEIPVLP
ncbi:MAG: hypothetical protein ACI3XR_01445 [Eubacteriales bacterium]